MLSRKTVQTFTCTKLNSLCPSQNHTSTVSHSPAMNGNSIFPISQTKNPAPVPSHNSNPIPCTGHSTTIHLAPSVDFTAIGLVRAPIISGLKCCNCLLNLSLLLSGSLFYSQSTCQRNSLKPDGVTSFFKIVDPPSESETKVLQEVSLSLGCLSLTTLAHLFFLEHTHNAPSYGLCTGCSLCLQSFLEIATRLTASATLSGAQMSLSIKSILF